MPYKNTAVTIVILAWDIINGVGKTGDSANLTVRGVGDGTEYTPSSPTITEIDSTNLKGVYSVALTAGENNYTFNMVGGKSSTSGIVVQPVQWMNEVTADIAKIATVTVSTTTAQLGVNVVKYNNQTAQSDASNLPKVDIENFGGTAGTFSGGLPDVNTKKVSGTSQTAVDIGAQLDATISSRAAAATALSSVTWTNTRAGYLDLLNTYLDSTISGIPAAVWSYVTRTITSGGITVAQVWDYLTSSISTSGSIGKLLKDDIDATISSRSTPAQVQTSVAAELDTAGAELSSIPGASGTLRQKLNFIFQYFNFKRTASNTTETLYKADSSTSLGTASISNSGSLFTKDKVT